MIRKLIFVSLLAVVQFGYAQRFNGGFVGGINGCQVDGDKYSGFHKIGLVGGLYTDTRFSDKLGARFEIRYSGRGAYEQLGTKDNPDIYQLSLKYAELPLSLNYYTSEDFILDAGLSASYLVGVALYDGAGKVSSAYIDPPFNKADVCWFLGANFRLGKNVLFNLRYAYSIIPIRNRNTGGYYYSFLARTLGYTEGDYNNFITTGIYYQLNGK